MARSAGKKAPAKKKTAADDKKYLCPYCLEEKRKIYFYKSTDPLVLTGITHICKDCVRKIALNWDDNRQEFGVCTKKSVMNALERIDRPFLSKLWESSYLEWSNGNRTTIWDAYIKNVGLKNYAGMRWRDGDIFETYVEDGRQVVEMESQKESNTISLQNNDEVNNEFEKNKRDVIRLLGYDPFDGEKLEDQPLLYSQLIGYLDLGGDGNEDMMRTSSAITIVRGFLQQAKLDDKIAKAMINTTSSSNVGEIKSLLDAKQKVSSTISQLAEQSCLSLKHNKNSTKGENTWTGKVKKIKELNLREGEVNGFDIMTCKGMQQVMDLSNASILKQLSLDESEYSDMLAEQRKMITSLRTEKDSYKEISRILLRENLDLKDVLADSNLLDDENLVDLEELFSAFSDVVSDDSEEVDQDEQDSEEL